MRTRIPLFAQTALVLLTNVALIASILLMQFNASSQFSPEDLIFGPAARTLHRMVFALEHQLVLSAPSGWNSILADYSRFYGVTLKLVDENGRLVAGAPEAVPREIVQAASKLVDGGSAFRPILLEAPPALQDKHPPTIPHFFRHTTNPNLFWIGILIPIPPSSSINMPVPRSHIIPLKMGTLLCSTENLWQSNLAEEARNSVLTLSIIVVLTLLIWYLFVFRITKSLTSLRDTARVISRGQFDTVARPTTIKEIEELNQDIVIMSSQIKEHLEGQKRFLADIAHELCSPLARLQIAIEMLVQDADNDKRQLVRDIREEVEQMSNLLNELLAFSKAAISGDEQTELVAINVCELLSVTVEKYRVNAVVEFCDPIVMCLGDETLLYRAFSNILRNSLRYAGAATPVDITVSRRQNEILVQIADRGPGVSAEALTKLGKPFYRPEAARTRETGGIGLGLAIVKTCIEACQGTLSIRNNTPHGLVVEIGLKRASENLSRSGVNIS